jgi:signal transduction histidine kinase
MLFDFIIAHREQLIARTRAKVAKRLSPRPTAAELNSGVPLFLEQLAETLRGPAVSRAEPGAIERAAKLHAAALQARGYSVAQVVYDYGDICQAITELAVEIDAPITTDEFQTLNRCLDNAIAEAVTEYTRLRLESATAGETERREILVQVRNRISSVRLAYLAIKSGRVPLGGSVALVVTRNLSAVTSLVDRALSEARLDAGTVRRRRTALYRLIEEAEVDGLIEADVHGVMLAVTPADHAIEVDADPQILASALGNLMQNALKFTQVGGQVSLKTSVVDGRVEIAVEDTCGGLPVGKAEELFGALQRHGAERGGLYLAHRGVEAHGGTLGVRNIAGQGCVFTIALPLLAPEAQHLPQPVAVP